MSQEGGEKGKEKGVKKKREKGGKIPENRAGGQKEEGGKQLVI